jgi:uncharacterized protein (TIGR02328 family)
MRLWHTDIIPLLPRQQLLGQHRECCALRGKGWGKKHSTVDYVFSHPYAILFSYHLRVMGEMNLRGYKIDPVWFSINYRGKVLGEDRSDFTLVPAELYTYPEHDDKYLNECLQNLKQKGAI